MKRKFMLSTLLFFTFALFVTPGLIIMLPFIFYIKQVAEKERIAVRVFFNILIFFICK